MGLNPGRERSLARRPYNRGMADVVLETLLPGLPPPRRGKVRDVYDLGDRVLLVATDRISAFDAVLSPGIPDKGRILTGLSNFWFRKFQDVVPNHLIETDAARFPEPLASSRSLLRGRSVLAKKCRVVPFECVARGYLAGSGWKEYRSCGEICGIALPAGLREADKLPHAIFTPSTKAPAGTHDENIGFARAQELLGPTAAARVRDKAVELYTEAAEYARTRGIIIADTKFEFGTDAAGQLYLIDEALTPDSSRFWPANRYRVGTSPPSFDKQFVRDWLEAQGWDKKPPAPALPLDVLVKTAHKYREALRLLTAKQTT